MKNLYHKNKGKIHPSPSSPSPPTSKPNPDSALAVLKFLPATILALASILSLEDREVLAYLITTNLSEDSKKKKCKKPNTPHKPPSFDCGCFECYTSYWFRWDSSPNRELIHQVIEAFEDHLNTTQYGGKKIRGKKRDNNNNNNNNNKVFDKTPTKVEVEEVKPLVPIVLELEEEKEEKTIAELETEVSTTVDGLGESEEVLGEKKEAEMEMEMEMVVGGSVREEEMVVQVAASSGPKGLARKVLPDVMGLFSSRIWSLWSTNF